MENIFAKKKINNYLSIKLLLPAVYPSLKDVQSYTISTEKDIYNDPFLLFQDILTFYQDKIFPKKFSAIWKSLSLALLGLTIEDLSKIHDMSKEQIEYFLDKFEYALIRVSDERWRLRSCSLQAAVFGLYLKTEEKKAEHHCHIARGLLNQKKFNAHFVLK